MHPMQQRRFAVFGAGRQGRAAAYDLAKFGNAAEIMVCDKDAFAAANAEVELNTLLGKKIVHSVRLDATNTTEVRRVLYDVAGFVSAMHYTLNPMLTRLAIEAGCHMIDMGGNTSVVFAQREFDRAAKANDISVIPDCGMAPGLNLNLIQYALGRLFDPRKLVNYCGGVPLRPRQPLGYHFPFALSGLVNECSGYADVIHDGEIRQISPLYAVEQILIPGIGLLEATHTSGGLSTAPWTFQDKYPALEILEYMTLRYPGHWKVLQDLAARGELESGLKAYEQLEQTAPHDPEDIGIISIRARGFTEDGKSSAVIIEVVDHYDYGTGFTAMQRLTGFHASAVLIAATEGLLESGVLAVESLDPALVIGALAKRGIVVDETLAVHAW